MVCNKGRYSVPFVIIQSRLALLDGAPYPPLRQVAVESSSQFSRPLLITDEVVFMLYHRCINL